LMSAGARPGSTLRLGDAVGVLLHGYREMRHSN
jgi:hypothetical protein